MSPDYNEDDDTPEPVPFADISNPQSLNLYTYGNNNPLFNVDADGHSTDCGGGGDKSVVCLVTTAIDKIKDFFSGSGGSGSSSGAWSPVHEDVFFTSSRIMMQPGVNYGNPNGPKGNNVGGCPLGTCHNFDGAFPPLNRTRFDGMGFMMGVLGGGFGVSLFSEFGEVGGRPSNVPADWLEQPTRKGGGKQYFDPTNRQNSVRVMPGNPNSPNPAQRVPYMKVQKSGVFQDINGNPVSGSDPASHIPIK